LSPRAPCAQALLRECVRAHPIFTRRLNKCDTVSEAQVQVLSEALAALNPQAQLLPTSHSKVEAHQILNTGECLGAGRGGACLYSAVHGLKRDKRSNSSCQVGGVSTALSRRHQVWVRCGLCAIS